MDSCKRVSQRQGWFRSAFHRLAVVFVLAMLSPLASGTFAQTGPDPECEELNKIHDLYMRHDKDKGIQILAKCMASHCYSESELRNVILDDMFDYFDRARDWNRFELMVYHLTKCGHSKVVLDKFSGTGLSSHAEKAVKEYETPTKIAIKFSEPQVEVGSAVGFTVQVKNARNDKLKTRDVDLDCDVDPLDCGTCDPVTRVFEARKPGTAKVTVSARENPEAMDSDTVIIPKPHKEAPPPEPVVAKIVPGSGPAGSTIQIYGDDFDDIPDSNKVVFIGASAVAERVITDAAGFDELGVTVPEGAISGPVFVRTPAGEAKSPTEFTVIVVPEKLPPSKKWAWISTAATGVFGVGFLYFNSEARIASDAGDESRWDELRPYEVGFGVATAAAATVSTYLWYRYYKQKGDHEKALEDFDGKIGMRFEPDKKRVMLSYRF